ncbi:TPA: hypothetical protein VIE58_001028 [Streptococcus pyogenes]|uniref:hypothetical protein n=1 Tax=Streptococcus pyogenes TaxID=1314 RepID=UPI0010A16E1F|nr:hypothetical protein [Streptococcus pyogenes]VGW08730.1 Uncharacterised protein [Streptococcus pyogenes]VHA57042.1 Uncharacterised protein [Streptococcus pyogenes]VHB71767.1 Uncharacterised protein [Streptococcus pyogenes]VHC66461.1 Uncharacterised protein [Streptococcus pyogenes]VHD18045.1 Uncharacterised protein [Streptococcus pyogenes]
MTTKQLLLYFSIFGTLLIMVQPIKAEENGFEKVGETSFQTSVQPLKEILQEDESKTKRFAAEEEEYDPNDLQDLGYHEGWQAGSNAPWWMLGPTIDEDRIPDPKREDWLKDQFALKSYKEGYAAGFHGGWYSNHEMSAFIQNTFYWLWNRLSNFLGI